MATALLLSLRGFAPGASALTVLQNPAGQTVVFDETHQTCWYRDLSHFAGLTYPQQLAGIRQLNLESYFGVANWHLAGSEEMRPLWEQSTDAIRGTFLPSEERYQEAYEWHYWSGRHEAGDSGLHVISQTGWGAFVFGPWDYAWPQAGYVSDVGSYQEHGAWVTSRIPEPGIGGLLLGGLAACLLLRPPRVCRGGSSLGLPVSRRAPSGG